MTILQTIAIATGMWRAVLLTPGGELPFLMESRQDKGNLTFTIYNGEERILLDDISMLDDSLIVRFPVYESELRLKIDNDTLSGYFVNLTRTTNAQVPLHAVFGNKQRFEQKRTVITNPSGKWEVTFSPMQKTATPAVGVFELHKDNIVTGTFLTPSGDYRFLEGVMDGDSLFLSTFDGVFAYLFKARVTGDVIRGMFYSGTHFSEPWAATNNENAALPDPDALTTLEGAFHFSFPDLDSNIVSFSDERYRNKVIVVQFLGSWCPNCLDETKYLAAYYNEHRQAPIAIVGLSFEKTDDFAKAVANVTRFKNRLGVNYDLLIAGNRANRKDIYPELKNFQGYPTTVILDKHHKVRKIHAGFNGPATGEAYEVYKREFESFMLQLINED